MKSKLYIKEALYQACIDNVDKRLATIGRSLSSIEESRNGETKSSVGDKHETGRAMMQLEEEKTKGQLHEVNLVKIELQKIDIEQKSTKAIQGSLVTTTRGEYYISIGIGKITVKDKLYYCVSMRSPIGARLLGGTVGDVIEFNGSEIEIQEIN